MANRLATPDVLESELERSFLRLVRASGHPEPRAQHTVILGRHRTARIDFAFVEHKIAVELDGYGFHEGRSAWERDLERQSRLAALGWTVLRFTWNDVTNRPSFVLETIDRTLRLSVPA